jgi:hypothetical protein
MMQFEYKVVPAPVRAEKIRGLKTVQDRFAATLTAVMNELGRDGWEYLRADTLPVEERVGFTGRQTAFQNMLVFRRTIPAATPAQPMQPIGMPAATVPLAATQPYVQPVAGVMASPGVMGAPPPVASPAPPQGPRVDWPVSGAAPALGPAKPLAAE